MAEVPYNKTWADVEDYKVREWGSVTVKFRGAHHWIELDGDTDQEDIPTLSMPAFTTRTITSLPSEVEEDVR